MNKKNTISENARRQQQEFNLLLDNINVKLSQYNYELMTDKLGLLGTQEQFNIVLLDELGLAETLVCGDMHDNYIYLKAVNVTIDLVNKLITEVHQQ